jgi:hypothetical protein
MSQVQQWTPVRCRILCARCADADTTPPGTIFSLMMIFFTLQWPKDGKITVNWWGNSVHKHSALRPLLRPFLRLTDVQRRTTTAHHGRRSPPAGYSLVHSERRHIDDLAQRAHHNFSRSIHTTNTLTITLRRLVLYTPISHHLHHHLPSFWLRPHTLVIPQLCVCRSAPLARSPWPSFSFFFSPRRGWLCLCLL